MGRFHRGVFLPLVICLCPSGKALKRIHGITQGAEQGLSPLGAGLRRWGGAAAGHIHKEVVYTKPWSTILAPRIRAGWLPRIAGMREQPSQQGRVPGATCPVHLKGPSGGPGGVLLVSGCDGDMRFGGHGEFVPTKPNPVSNSRPQTPASRRRRSAFCRKD